MIHKFARYIATVSLGLAAAILASSAWAQDTVRVRGTIERVDGPVYVVKARDGSEVKVTLADKALVVAIVKATLADIKPGTFVGVTGMPQTDGSQKAVEVHIFPEAMRGTGEGHYAWDLRPQSTMTNANVEQVATGVDGQTLSVKYKDGEKKLVVPTDVPIVTYVTGNTADLRPGAKIFIAAAKKRTAPFRRHASIMARTASRRRCELFGQRASHSGTRRMASARAAGLVPTCTFPDPSAEKASPLS